MGKIFMTGASGNLARVITPVLHQAGLELTLGSRQRPEVVPGGAEYTPVDLTEPAHLEAAFSGHETLILISPVVKHEVGMVENALAAARQAGVKKVVAIGIMNEAKRVQIPHFENKRRIVELIKESGLEYVILKPSFFFQNDGMVLAPLREHDVYALPIGSVGLNAVDTRDIADATLRVVTSETFDGQEIPLCSPDRCTGEGNAQVWSEVLGKEITYAGDDLGAFTAGIRNAFATTVDEWLVDDLTTMMRINQTVGNHATDHDLAASETVLGHAPRRYKDFVAETAAAF
ncbi:NmrA-like family protein [Luminiphilus syltensis NOR5-1B]|uniref:NmrA-like family protein n=1 Tax=Luminiphilus syltensis NOR5-1B TaxID=565045 RepID=B8KXJ5_9GAMM|nr:NmrA family NAD(P)-binding protein [Luminiphilus syltensis]EED35273.1 NmrA-like family protein [Luminiphilus syltensis NOR5-1B]